MGKINFFADLDVLNYLLGMKYDMKALPAMDLTVDILELPFWFSLKNGESSRSLTIYTQMELYSKNEEMSVSKASVILDDASGNAKVTAPQGLGENMAAFYIACRNLSLFAKEKGLDQLWGGSDPEQAGILLTARNGSLNWKLVSGAARPELTVERMMGGTIKMRPYMDDFWDRSETEMMPLEDRIQKAEGGDKFAIAKLATAYLNGDDEVEQNPEKAAYWYRKEAELGESEGAFNLGLLYAKGFGVKRDFAQAAEWMEKAVAWGDEDGKAPAAQYRAMAESLKRAEAGDAEAMAKLAGDYMMLGNSLNQAGSDEDYAECLKWAQKSADAGCAAAYWPLALAYEHGRGVLKDDKKAIDLYRQGAEGGNAPCQHSYGCRLITGEGVKKDTEQALALFEKSAEQGYTLAYKALGRMYETGEGVEPDFDKELEYYEKVCLADPGDAEFLRHVGFQYTNLLEDKEKWLYAVERAAYWLRKAADQGDGTAAGGADIYERILELHRKGIIPAGASVSECMGYLSGEEEKKKAGEEAEAERQRLAREKAEQERREQEQKEQEEQQKVKIRDAEQKILAKVDAVLAKARKAGAEYEVSAMKIEQKVSRTTINVSSQSSMNELRSIVKDCASACDKLYLAYQNLVHELDSELRGFLAHKPGAYAIRAVTGTITWLNEESRIQNNYAAQFDGIDLGQLVKKEYQPRPENLDTERFWKKQYNELSEKEDAESRWADKLREHKRLASEEERKAKEDNRKSEQETRDLIRNLAKEEKAEIDRELEEKKKEFQAQYSVIQKRMDYCMPAKDLLFFRAYNYGYVAPDGTPRINYDENHIGCVVRKMHDLKQVICLDVGVVGLGKDGRCQLSNIYADDVKRCGLGECKRWRNVRKIAGCSDSNQVIGLLEDGHCVATTPSYDCGVHHVSGWSNIVDVVCEQYYAAGLRKDGTVIISGTGTIADRLRKMVSGWKDVIAIFNYSTGHLAALKEDGTVLPDTAEMKEPATAAKNIIAIAKNSNGPVYLQADGTVVATKRYSGGWGGKNSEGYVVSTLKNVVAIYTGKDDFAVLCEDGFFRVYDDYRNNTYELNKGAPIFRSYKEYYNEIRQKEQALSEKPQKENDRNLRREEEEQKKRDEIAAKDDKKETEPAVNQVRKAEKTGKKRNGFLTFLLIVALLIGGLFAVRKFVPEDKLPPYLNDVITKLSEAVDSIISKLPESFPKKTDARSITASSTPVSTPIPTVYQEEKQAGNITKTIDYSPFINSDKYKFEYYDDGYAVIRANIPQNERAFHPDYKEGGYYSHSFFDLLIANENTDPLYIPRLWIYCYPVEYHNFTGVTITINGINYKFSDIGLPEYKMRFEKAVQEELLIIFDENNKSFLNAIMKIAQDYKKNNYKGLEDFSISIVLHGDDDVTGKMDEGFLRSFFTMMDAWEILGQGNTLKTPDGSKMYIS